MACARCNGDIEPGDKVRSGPTNEYHRWCLYGDGHRPRCKKKSCGRELLGYGYGSGTDKYCDESCFRTRDQ